MIIILRNKLPKFIIKYINLEIYGVKKVCKTGFRRFKKLKKSSPSFSFSFSNFPK